MYKNCTKTDQIILIEFVFLVWMGGEKTPRRTYILHRSYPKTNPMGGSKTPEVCRPSRSVLPWLQAEVRLLQEAVASTTTERLTIRRNWQVLYSCEAHQCSRRLVQQDHAREESRPVPHAYLDWVRGWEVLWLWWCVAWVVSCLVEGNL